jgi:hypothetical protein
MRLWDIFKRNNKIKEQRFFDYNKRSLNIEGIKAVIPNEDFPLEIGIGEFGKSNLPIKVSEKLKEMDLLQHQIAVTINSLSEEGKKEEKKETYIAILLKMIAITQNKGDACLTSNVTNNEQISSSSSVKIYDALRLAGNVIANMKSDELETPGLIIWPITLKNRLSIIHKAQIEVLRVLQTKHWNLKIIIAACGDQQEKEVPKFKKEILKQLKKRHIECEGIEILNSFFDSKYSERGDILTNFIDISNELKMDQLSSFNKKDNSYPKEVMDKIEKRPVLKFIQPILTWSVVLHLAESFSEDKGSKAIVIAGRDEENQWKHVFEQIFSNIGAIFIPILKTQDGKSQTAPQDELLQNFFSEDEVVSELCKGNISKWLFDSFVQLPIYPEKPKLRDVGLCGKACKPDEDCGKCLFPDDNVVTLPEHVDKNKFVKQFWHIINPA